jgi:hypothetical protein
MENKLSFDINDKEQFRFFKKNVFEDAENTIHYLFSHGKFLFWVSSVGGTVAEVAGTQREEMEDWNENSLQDDLEPESGDYFVTDEEYEVHLSDARELNTPYYLNKLQDKVKYL